MIIKHGKSYIIKNEAGTKTLGVYSSKEKAEERLKQIEYFKNVKK